MNPNKTTGGTYTKTLHFNFNFKSDGNCPSESFSILWHIFAIENNCFLSKYVLKCNLFLLFKAVFSASFLQDFSVTWSSEIIQETLLNIIINVEHCWVASYFCGNRDAFYFSAFLDEISAFLLIPIFTDMYFSLCLYSFSGFFDE